MDIKEKIKKQIKFTFKNFLKKDMEEKDIFLGHSDNLMNGDYFTNEALVQGSLLPAWPGSPQKLAEKIVEEINKNKVKEIKKIEAKNGFINFFLSREFFAEGVKEILENKNFGQNDLLTGKKIMVEYTDPNPFKPFHIGHLMTNAIGESISRIIEFSGAKVIRANYQGDIGPHVAKAIYGLLKFGLPDEHDSISQKAHYIGELYTKGNDSYENDEKAKTEIDEINKKIYNRSDKKINEIYDWGRKVTLDAFEEIYKILGTKFDKYYFESQMANVGKKIVMENCREARPNDNKVGIFEKSDGAIIFHAEKYDSKLHTRVFINSQGLPTYETKELGLTMTKFKKNLFTKQLDLSVVTTAIEQAEYMKVVQKAIALIYPNLENKMKHITHGMMRFASGKMSSRRGNVITGESLLQDSMDVVLEKIRDREFKEEPARPHDSSGAGGEKKKISEIVGVSALKYSILKQSIGGDIIYDFEKSISFEGDSGPYLQYSYARARSILEKAKAEKIKSSSKLPENWETTDVEKILYKFPEIVLCSAQEFEPHYIANYLIDLARAYNTYYGNTKIINKDDSTSPYKITLTEAFSLVMKNGLWLLGIQIPERM